MDERKVFISYSAGDTKCARSFAQALKDRGVTVWFDEFQIQPGDSWNEAHESALRGSDVLVALLNAESSSKPYLFFELGAAIAMGKRVVSIVPKEMGSDDLPLPMKLRRYLTRESPEQTAEELSNTLKAA